MTNDETRIHESMTNARMTNESGRTRCETIYIVHEFNTDQAIDLIAPTTVWACVGNSDRYDETGTKVAGPIPGLFADKVVEGLAVLLGRLGYAVVVEVAVDD